jgi:mannose-6-phosphate isomerase-like protein (cupin superfamily)
MADATRNRLREREPTPSLKYDLILGQREEFMQHAMTGQIVVREDEREWETNRQGFCKYILLDSNFPETVLQDWWVFLHDIRKQSGKHRHQGGLVIFVLEGEGATSVNGEMIDWETGDCLLLPFHPDGVDHQHFNRGNGTAKWLAFIHLPTWNHSASEMTQTQIGQEFKDKTGA